MATWPLRQRRRDGQLEHDGATTGTFAPARRCKHCGRGRPGQLHLYGYEGGDADHHGVGERPQVGHAAGNRDSGGGQSACLRHGLADHYGRGCLQHDRASTWRTSTATWPLCRRRRDGQLEHDVATTGTFAPASPLSIAAGADQVSFTYTDTKAGTPTLTAAAKAASQVSQQETVIAAAASQLAFATASQTITAGVASNAITLDLEDQYGNLADASGGVTVNLSHDFNRGARCARFAGDHRGRGRPGELHLYGHQGGDPDAHGSGHGSASVTQQETVIPAAASQLAFATAPQTITAGVASNPITLDLEDPYGNLAAAGGGVTVNLSHDFKPRAPSRQRRR